MLEHTRESIMSQLNITEIDLGHHSKEVVEKLFCCIILNQGVDMAAKILTEYTKLRDILYGKKSE